MASVTVRLHERDRARLREELAETVVGRILEEFRPVLEQAKTDSKVGQGIQVLSLAEVTQRLGKSQKQIYRLEGLRQFPRRRQLSQRRVGYFAHEIDEIPVEAVRVRDHRTLTREALSAKVGLDKKTVAKMVKHGEMPPDVNGRWLERDIDEWLLNRPLV